MTTIAPLLLLLACASASLAQLSGPLSGTLGPGEFHVIDTISVEAGDSLTLLPGTTFTFDGPYPFYIFGTLLAEGTESDSIYFTTNLVDSRRRWQGLRFYNDGGSRSILAYCVIQNVARLTLSGGGVDCYESSPGFSNCTIRGNRSRSGGGVYCWDTSSPTFRECTFVENSASQSGGGAYCASNSSPHFVGCIFEANRALSYGGGVYCQNRSSPTFTNCSMTGNEAGSSSQAGGGGIYCESSSIIFSDCTISANHALGDGSCGGGVYCRNASPTFTNCTINNDSACEGGAVFCREHSSPSFVNCSLGDNLAARGGGGMTCHESSPSFRHCTFNGNSVSSFGGAAYCDNSSPILDDCTITNNSGSSGGGVCCRTSSAHFTNCFFSGNMAGSYGGGFSGHGCSSNFIDCSFSGNSACVGGGVSCLGSSASFVNALIDNNSGGTGGGVYCDHSCPSFMNCTIRCNEATGDNSQSGDGGGIYCDESSPCFINSNIIANRTYRHGSGIHCAWASSPSFVNCALSDNSSYGLTGAGGAVHCWRSSPSFTNCVLSGNSVNAYGGGVYCNDSSPWLVNCSLSSNTAGLYGGGVYCYDSSPVLISTIIAFSVGTGIYFVYAPESQFGFCDFHGNDGGTFGGWGGPTRLGELIRTNANGDSCDSYFNIFLDPMFVDTAARDFHLLAGSPCIDAGDPTLPFDPDSTIADIGAFYFDQSAVEPSAILLPTAYALHPNWPNPFNSSTMIRYDVPQAGRVSLTIFNPLGQRVATLFDGRQLAGSHTINWGASGLPSGLYLCRMAAAEFSQTRKLLLVK